MMKRIVQKKFKKKLNYLLKQKLTYNGELITLTINVTIFTYLILILLYILIKVLQMGYHRYILIQGTLAYGNVTGHQCLRVESNQNRNLYILQKQRFLTCQSYGMTMSQLLVISTTWGA